MCSTLSSCESTALRLSWRHVVVQAHPDHTGRHTPAQPAAHPVPSHLWPQQDSPEPFTPPQLRTSTTAHQPHPGLWQRQAFQRPQTPVQELGMPSPLLLPRLPTNSSAAQQGQQHRMMSSPHLMGSPASGTVSSASRGPDLSLPVQPPLWLDSQGSRTKARPSSPAMPQPHLHTILQGLRR